MATEATDRGGFRPSPFWMALGLAVALVGAKAVHWGAPWSAGSGARVWLRDLLISSHSDVSFAAGFGVLAFVLLGLASGWPALARTLGALLLALGAFCAVYAVASVQIFDFLRSPLTYPLLYLAGDMGSMRSSIGSFVTPGIVAGMVIVPACYIAAVSRLSRRGKRPAGRGRWLVPVAVLAVAAGWAQLGGAASRGRWSDRSDVLIAHNPHWEFLTSVVAEWSGGADMPAMDAAFPPEFLADFQHSVPAVPVAFPVAREREPGVRPRNIIQVVLESTGARYLSLYGSSYKTTPALDTQARHALVFDAFYAHAGFTANALAAMSLSLHPYMTWREYTQEYPDFPGETVADVLKPQGYRTAFITSGYLDYVCMGCFLRGRGFDTIRDWRDIGGGQELTSWGGHERNLVDDALSWIAEDSVAPFYITLWTQQSHHPYEPLPETPLVDFFAGRPLPPDDYDLGRYLNTLAQVDLEMGRLLSELERRGLAQDTIVVFTGDHGEAFGQPHETWGHGFRVYDENMRVPLMIWSPALFPSGRRVPTVGGHVDLNPTLLDLVGVAAPESWEGRSLFAPERPPRTYFYAANDDYLLGVREGDYKYIFNVTRGREELYDLARDPDEQANIAPSHPERCRRLRQRLSAWKHHAAGRLASARATIQSARLSNASTAVVPQ